MLNCVAETLHANRRKEGLEIVITPIKEGNQGIDAKHICI